MLGLGLALVPVVWADPASDACAALVDSRSALYFMINAKDKAVQDAFNEKSKWQALRGQYYGREGTAVYGKQFERSLSIA